MPSNAPSTHPPLPSSGDHTDMMWTAWRSKNQRLPARHPWEVGSHSQEKVLQRAGTKYKGSGVSGCPIKQGWCSHYASELCGGWTEWGKTSPVKERSTHTSRAQAQPHPQVRNDAHPRSLRSPTEGRSIRTMLPASGVLN